MSLAQNIKKTINYSKKNGYGEAVVAAWERVTAKYYADYSYQAPDALALERQRGGQSGVSAQILDSRTGIRDAARVYGGID